MTKIAPHIPAAHTASYDRLMRLADQVLAALEIAQRPATAIEIGRTARAIVAFERMLRTFYARRCRKRNRSRFRNRCDRNAPSVSSPSRRSTFPVVPSPVTLGETAPVRAKGAKPQATPADAPHGEWSKGWVAKQAQMREQRAARIGR